MISFNEVRQIMVEGKFYSLYVEGEGIARSIEKEIAAGYKARRLLSDLENHYISVIEKKDK